MIIARTAKVAFAGQMVEFSLMFALALVYLNLVFAQAPSEAPLQALFQGLSTAEMQLLGPDSPYLFEEASQYPAIAQFLISQSLKYNPSLERQPIRESCQQKFTDPVFYLEQCESELKTNRNNLLVNTYQTMMLDLDPLAHPNARFYLFHLARGVRVKGLLALKGDGQKRPLVVLRLGIFSNAREFLPERYLFMQLFEQSPFNLLILESTSSPEFIRRNQFVSFGGVDEGVQNLQISRLLKNQQQKISSLVSGIHLMAVSFGGHGALFASLLNHLSSDKPINSVTSFCPLIHFRDTFDYHIAQGYGYRAMELWIRSRLGSVSDITPNIRSDHFLEDLFLHLEKTYQGPPSLSADVQMPVAMRNHLHKFWQLNDYWGSFRQVQTPMLILSTQKDPIVPFALNTGRLLSRATDLADSNLKYFVFSEGYHCSMPGAYDWYGFAAFLQNSILNFEPKIQFIQKSREYALPQNIERVSDWTVRASPGQHSLILKVTFSDQELAWWQQFGRRWREFAVPVADLDFFHPHAIVNASDARMLERWAMQNLKLQQQSDRLVVSWPVIKK